MRKIILILSVFFLTYSAASQNVSAGMKNNVAERPKLVVGIVIDQMRWDYLYRYYNLYSQDGGFKRLISQGFSCDNTLIPYIPTVTACGHTSIFTGSIPAIDGITGNDWWDYDLSKLVYCSEDDSVRTIGSNTEAGKMSPRNLLVTTIGDELRLATNFHNKVIGIALKDRGAILPAGHSANAAYWYDDKTGDWITSSYYMDELPQWLKDLNAKKWWTAILHKIGIRFIQLTNMCKALLMKNPMNTGLLEQRDSLTTFSNSQAKITEYCQLHLMEIHLHLTWPKLQLVVKTSEPAPTLTFLQSVYQHRIILATHLAPTQWKQKMVS
jgi:hypothetical protein